MLRYTKWKDSLVVESYLLMSPAFALKGYFETDFQLYSLFSQSLLPPKRTNAFGKQEYSMEQKQSIQTKNIKTIN